MPTTVSAWGRQKPLCPASDTCQDTDSLPSVRTLFPGKTPCTSHDRSSSYAQAKWFIPHSLLCSQVCPSTSHPGWWAGEQVELTRWASRVFISPYQNASRSLDRNHTLNCIYRTVVNCFNKTLLEKTFLKIQITHLEHLPQWEYYDSEGKQASSTKEKVMLFSFG